ncbi:MAG: anhydro-N-acetylmuramic acid kinase [Verrucomicrobiales bacterium]|nr:anhydro-N-acetylmuramic acid kinase [Verrucomicrobiales bacterium]
MSTRSIARPSAPDTVGAGVASGTVVGSVRMLGMMSGTSLDGVDCVLTEFDAAGVPRWVRRWARRFPAGLAARLRACASGSAASWECGQLHHDLGRFYARVAAAGVRNDRIDAVGLHGQTVFHRGGGTAPATWQIGEPAYLVEALGVPVVFGFRAADMAAGGQGAPLATLFHVRAFATRGEHVCVQNLGGIGNVTSIDWRTGERPRVMSFDTGPGNMPIDGAVRRLTRGRETCDRDGARAAAGRVSEVLVRRWVRDPFVRKAPPKSTGRERFGDPYLERLWPEMDALGLAGNDRIATLTELTARTVVANYKEHLGSRPTRIVVCGGGAKNPELMRRLSVASNALGPGMEFGASTKWGWPVDSVEGGAFALLARERLLRRPGNLPETTGARRAVLCGAVIEP